MKVYEKEDDFPVKIAENSDLKNKSYDSSNEKNAKYYEEYKFDYNRISDPVYSNEIPPSNYKTDFSKDLAKYSSEFNEKDALNRSPEKLTFTAEKNNSSSGKKPLSPEKLNISPQKNQGLGLEKEESPENNEEVVYHLDEDGFLMDEKGNYIVDENEQMIKLSDEHIDYLRKSNMIEDDK